MKYTIVYVESWMVGSHMQSITQMLRSELNTGETILDMLEREGIQDPIYIFEGWPRLEGEYSNENT